MNGINHHNHQSAIATASENTELTQSTTQLIYQKPKTTLFLEQPANIQGGSTNVPESNSGLLQS